MNKDKKKVLLISLAIFAVLLVTLFIKVENSKIITAVFTVLLAVLTFLTIKRRRSLSINKKEVLLLLAVMAGIYVALKEITGIYFGFYKNPYFVNSERILSVIIPTALIIVAIEVIRYVILAQNIKSASILTYLSCVLADMLIYSNISGIVNFNRFMDLVGLTIFPAISANVFYHYVSKKYGPFPNIVFRLITALYVYFIPTITSMEDSLDSCIRIIFPIAMLSLTSALFEKKSKKAIKQSGKFSWIGMALTVIVVVSVAMVISCQFRFGALVIATESMTGEINKGDMILYERYDGQKIEEGQVIVFRQDEARIVHRVIQIENINGEVRYYTKGDANEDRDSGYRLDTDIVGLTDVKLAFIGYPTLLLREIIQK